MPAALSGMSSELGLQRALLVGSILLLAPCYFVGLALIDYFAGARNAESLIVVWVVTAVSMIIWVPVVAYWVFYRRQFHRIASICIPIPVLFLVLSCSVAFLSW